MARIILHADMDAFFAAVEIREDPALAGRPVVVGADPRGGSGRGVVAACNYEARAYGIHSAMPISQAYRRCPHAAFLPVRASLYAEVSGKIMAILRGYTELVEQLSIDEAFLDVSGSTRLFGDGRTIARHIKRNILESERLTVSVGVAPNKFLAKLASDLNKPDGLVVVELGTAVEFLRPLPVSRLWGVGPKTEDRLRSLGITTIGEVAATSLGRLVAVFGEAHARHLHDLANGIDDRPVEPEWERKQVGKETTFETDIEDRELVRITLLALTEDVAASLRRRGVVGRTVTLKLRLAPFETLTRRRTVTKPLSTTEAIYPLAVRLLEAADPGDRPIRLVGVAVSGLHESGADTQLSLFDDEHDADASRVAEAFDTISSRFGRGAVRRGKLLQKKRNKGPGS